jgi:transcription antitermination factor NusG
METDMPPAEPTAWYVVRVKANAERRVAQSLSNRGIMVFLPLQSKPGAVKRSGRPPAATPLFPGYVFACFDKRHPLRVLACPGVVHIVSRGHNPEAVDAEEMFALQTLARTAKSVSALPALTAGQKIRIGEGPLADVEGIVVRDNGRDRLIVSITLLARSVIAEVEREWIDCPHSECRTVPWVTPWLAGGDEKRTGDSQ